MDKLKCIDSQESKLKLSADRKVSPLSIFSESQQEWKVKVKNAFGLPAGDSCPGATEWCFSETGGKCYANKIQKYRPNVDKLVHHNLDLLKAARSAKGMTKLLVEMIGSIKWYGTDQIFRYFWDGDLFSKQFTKAVAASCRAFPEIRFWLYTRSFQFVKLLADTPNLVVYLSVDCYNVEKAKKTKSDSPWVKLAFSADTWKQTEELAALFPGERKGPKCPELTKRIPLVNKEGVSACVACGLCIKGVNNVRFSSSNKGEVVTIGRPKGSGVVPLEDRLWARVDKTESCWYWTGPLSNYGYGKIGEGGQGGKVLSTHRVAYSSVYGLIPEDKEIDHTCHTKECGKTGKECLHRRCVNPDHLIAVSHRENSVRDECTNSGKNIVKTHCPSGHLYNEENTRWEKNRHGLLCRKCRVCDRLRARKKRGTEGGSDAPRYGGRK